MLLRPGKCLTNLFSLALTCLTLCANSAQANVVRDDRPALLKDIPLYSWQDKNVPTRAVAIAVHGVTMHGAVFDTMARSLAASGIVVYAPDLRGYGRWMSDDKFADRKSSTVDYETSYTDLRKVITLAKGQHPNLPTFAIGESLGADLVLHAAGDMPLAFDGIILSSPAVKPRSLIVPKLELGSSMMANPWKQMRLERFIEKYASEDPLVAEGALADPLVRKSLSAVDLYHTAMTVGMSLDYARKVPATLPVLVIQGSEDKMVQSKAVIKLISKLKSTDQTVRWFRDRGHLLLETAYIRPDTLETLDQWLGQRMHKIEMAHVHAAPKEEVQAPVVHTAADDDEMNTIASRLLVEAHLKN